LGDDFPWIDELTHNLVSMPRRGHSSIPGKESPMPIGTVKFFNEEKGYGFIQPEDGGKDSFVHISAVQASGMMTLDRDQRVSYEVETGRNGKESAVNLASA
jgi:cold shock protein